MNRYRWAPNFGIGDWVFILKRMELTSRFSDKLDFPMTWSYYEIVKDLGNDSF